MIMIKTFQKLVRQYFNFLENDFVFKGFKSEKGYLFSSKVIFANESIGVEISFDEREGYMVIKLFKLDEPEKSISLDQIIMADDPSKEIKLTVNDNKIKEYKKIFGKYAGEGEELKRNAEKFIINKEELEEVIRVYSEAMQKYYPDVFKNL